MTHGRRKLRLFRLQLLLSSSILHPPGRLGLVHGLLLNDSVNFGAYSLILERTRLTLVKVASDAVAATVSGVLTLPAAISLALMSMLNVHST